MYNRKVIEHFISPQNVGRIKDADGIGVTGDPSCGDYLRICIKVDNHRITDIKFEIFGCPAAIATSSVLTEKVKGMTLDEAWEINDEDILEALGGLPENKKHCSNLGVETLSRAIMNYLARIAG